MQKILGLFLVIFSLSLFDSNKLLNPSNFADDIYKIRRIKLGDWMKNININEYTMFLDEIKKSIQAKQLEAFRSVNRALIELYWQIGKKIVEKQKQLD